MKRFLKYFLIFGLCTLSCSGITPEEQQKQMTQLLDVINKQQKTLEKISKTPKSSLLAKSVQAVGTVTALAGLGYLAFTQHKLINQNAELYNHIAGLYHQTNGVKNDLGGLLGFQTINMVLSLFGLTSALSASDGVHRLLSLVRNR